MSGKFLTDALPAASAVAITPSDSVDLETPTRGLYVGAAGNVKVDMVDNGTAIVFTGLAAGVIHPIRCKRVYSTGTSATGLVGVY